MPFFKENTGSIKTVYIAEESMVHTLLYKTFFNNKYLMWFSSMMEDLIYKKKNCPHVVQTN